MKVYKLMHRRHIEYKLHTGEWVTDNRTCGFFRTAESAQSAKAMLLGKPGFCDFPEDFTIDVCEVSAETDSVYLVEHSYYIIDDRTDNIVEIGVFATESEAMTAAAEYEATARFPVGSHSWDEDFDIDNYLSVAKYELDTAEFTDGFVVE